MEFVGRPILSSTTSLAKRDSSPCQGLFHLRRREGVALALFVCIKKQLVVLLANWIDIRLVHLGLLPSDGLLGSSALLARAALLGGVSALPMRCMRGVFRVGLLGSRL